MFFTDAIDLAGEIISKLDDADELAKAAGPKAGAAAAQLKSIRDSVTGVRETVRERKMLTKNQENGLKGWDRAASRITVELGGKPAP